MLSDLDVPYNQLANFDCTREYLMLLFSGEKKRAWLWTTKFTIKNLVIFSICRRRKRVSK